jgi:hypothetical protein
VTVLEVITSSLRLIGQLGPGRVAGPSETADALFGLNRMLESWANDRLLVYAIDRNTFALQANKTYYTIGPSGADWTLARPLKLDNVGLMIDAQTEIPLEQLTEDEYAVVRQKALTSTQPTEVFYEASYPNGTVFVWPTPTEVRNLVLYTYGRIATFASASDTLALPPGYADAIRYNLALRLAPEWGKTPRPDVAAMAVESLSRIKTTNSPVLEMAVDPAMAGRGAAFDWRTGEV